MLDLKTIFGNAYIDNQEGTVDPHSYYWFRLPSGHSFGIRKSGVTDKELQLLNLHYIALDAPLRPLSPIQRAWSELLFGEFDSSTFSLHTSLTQFAFIQLKSILYDLPAFEEAILGYFPEDTTILWPDSKLAVLIIPVHPLEETNGMDLIELVNADFYVNAKLFYGAPFLDPKLAPQLFYEERRSFEMAQKAYPEKYVFSYTEMVPFILVHSNLETLSLYFGALNAYLEEDPEMRLYLETFFNHDLNLSTTAKALFMHRNSLHYRLDKLRDQTGLDPRRFHDALFISLELFLHKLKPHA